MNEFGRHGLGEKIECTRGIEGVSNISGWNGWEEDESREIRIQVEGCACVCAHAWFWVGICDSVPQNLPIYRLAILWTTLIIGYVISTNEPPRGLVISSPVWAASRMGHVISASRPTGIMTSICTTHVELLRLEPGYLYPSSPRFLQSFHIPPQMQRWYVTATVGEPRTWFQFSFVRSPAKEVGEKLKSVARPGRSSYLGDKCRMADLYLFAQWCKSSGEITAGCWQSCADRGAVQINALSALIHGKHAVTLSSQIAFFQHNCFPLVSSLCDINDHWRWSQLFPGGCLTILGGECSLHCLTCLHPLLKAEAPITVGCDDFVRWCAWLLPLKPSTELGELSSWSLAAISSSHGPARGRELVSTTGVKSHLLIQPAGGALWLPPSVALTEFASERKS